MKYPANLLVAALALLISFVVRAAAPPEPTPEEARQRHDAAQAAYRQWQLDTSLGDYDRFGRKDPRWDAAVRKALQLAVDAPVHWIERFAWQDLSEIASLLTEAVASGCDDPLVLHYLSLVVEDDPGETDAERTTRLVKLATALEDSQYSPLHKIWGWRQARLAAQQGISAKEAIRAPEVPDWRSVMVLRAHELIRDTNVPMPAVYLGCRAILGPARTMPVLGLLWRDLEPDLITYRGQEPLTYLLRGTFYVNYAFQARSAAAADKVNESRWKLFAERLAKAEEFLSLAARLDPFEPLVPTFQLGLELGQDRGRWRMEVYFRRALALDTNNFMACQYKLQYIEPKWGGSEKEMLEFGRQTVTNRNWNGGLAFTLIEAHTRLAGYVSDFKGAEAAADYWKIPLVWRDLAAAYERALLATRDPTTIRQQYIRDARRSEQWGVVLQQGRLLTRTNLSYFGGRAGYDAMMDEARRKGRR